MNAVKSVFKVFGIIIGVVAGLFVIELLIVALRPGMKAPPQRLGKPKRPEKEAEEKPMLPREDVIVEEGPSLSRKDISVEEKASLGRRNVSFQVDDTTIRAWLYMPEALSTPVPCIVMGHGLGGTKDMGLDQYAVRYQEAGYAVLAFDYRCFGESDGEPRQLLWIPNQLEDYAGAVAYARSLEEIDPERIALWGTSASGGHVIVTAARDNRIACVVSQCPGLDGHASAEMAYKRVGLQYGLRLVAHGQRDLVRSWLHLSPHKIPIVGKPGALAVLPGQEAYEAYGEFVTENFVNEVCARINIRGDKYRPVKHAKKIQCPVLLQICEEDNFTPISAAKETEKMLGDLAEAKYYPIGHFDIYHGEDFERAVNDQLEFFRENL